jgi:hypothetical protein
MDSKNFIGAILEGAKDLAPSSNNAAISNFFTPTFRAGAVQRAGRAMDVTSAQDADEEKKRREAARQAEIQKLQDSMDPNKYQKQRKDDGGFAFFDPSGKEIDIHTYAQRTGQRRVDVLKDSENPLDQQYIDDWSQMNDLNQAVWRNDKTAMDTFPAEFRSLTPEQINRKLLEKYPHIYGMGNYQKSLSNLGNSVFKNNRSAGTTETSNQGGRRSGLPL